MNRMDVVKAFWYMYLNDMKSNMIFQQLWSDSPNEVNLSVFI